MLLRSIFLTIAIAFVPLAVQADNEGASLLDEAIEIKLTAQSLPELGKVIDLAQKAIDAGLDEENTEFAEGLLVSALMQRANGLGAAIFKASPTNPQIAKQLPRLIQVALADVRRVIELDPTQMEAQYLLGRLYSLPGGNREMAREALTAALQLVEVDDQRAKILTSRGDVQDDRDARLADYNAALEIVPDQVVALRHRGQLLVESGDAEAAVADFDAALEINPDDPETLEARGVALGVLGRHEEAMEALGKAIEIHPRFATAYIHRARLLIKQQQYKDAINDLDKSILVVTTNPLALILRATCYEALNDTDRALADVRRALKLQPNFLPAIQIQANLLLATGQINEALGVVEVLQQRLSGNPQILLQLGVMYRQANRVSDAIAAFSAALVLDDRLIAAYHGRADALMSLGKQTEAIADYEKSLELSPKAAVVLNNLAWLLATSVDDAVRDGQRSLELATEASEVSEYKEAFILSTLAAAYAELGDFESARKWIGKAKEISPERLVGEIEKEAARYEEEKPWREDNPVEDVSQGVVFASPVVEKDETEDEAVPDVPPADAPATDEDLPEDPKTSDGETPSETP